MNRTAVRPGRGRQIDAGQPSEPANAASSRLARIGLFSALLFTATAAIIRLSDGFLRLVRPWDGEGGWDIELRWAEVHAWFAGQPVYGVIESADYPPASYVLLWPFTGWADQLHARWIWAATTACALLWLGWILARESPARSRAGLLWFGLLPASSYATFSCLLTGQVTILQLALVLAGTLAIVRGRSWPTDLVGAAAIVAGLIKPTVAVPLVWVAMLVPGRVRPAALIVGGYAGVTMVAARLQHAPIFDLLLGWLAQDSRVDVTQTAANLQKLMHGAGLAPLFLYAALLTLLATGFWVYRHRRIDVFLLLGVTALVARFWTYHRRFDDLLILIPVLALFRLAARQNDGDRQALLAGGLGVALTALLLAPNQWLSEFSFREEMHFVQGVAWLAALGFLLVAAARERRALRSASADAAWSAGRPSLLSGSLTERVNAWMSHRSRWPKLCVWVPAVVLPPMYAWLSLDSGTPWLWSVVVHEGGRHTLGETVLYFDHFLRELPTLVAMVLFGIAAVGVPVVAAGETRTRWRYAVAVGAAAVLAVTATVATVAEHGLGDALHHVLQYYTRDDTMSFGSHWRYHWLSTLWYGAAALLVARLAALWLGAPRSEAGDRGGRLMAAAWLYFAILTLIFGLSTAIFSDPLHIGHQAREIATHALVTLPLSLAILAILARRHRTPEAGAPAETRAPAPSLEWYHFALVLAIPMYFVLSIQYSDVVAAGQNDFGLAPMIATHFFEHTLDYVFVALLTYGVYGLLCSPRRSAAP